MKWSNILNFLLCIIILHLILLNVDMNYSFGIQENYDCDASTIDDTYSDPKEDLLNYINDDYPEGSNYFSSNDNSSNFQSDVMDINKFYDIEKLKEDFSYHDDSLQPNLPEYADLDAPSCLKETSIDDIRNGMSTHSLND